MAPDVLPVLCPRCRENDVIDTTIAGRIGGHAKQLMLIIANKIAREQELTWKIRVHTLHHIHPRIHTQRQSTSFTMEAPVDAADDDVA